MKLSIARIALIGSLRSRIVVIIALMTIAVQLAMYTIVESTNEEFEKSHRVALTQRIAQIVPALFEAEYVRLDNFLQQVIPEQFAENYGAANGALYRHSEATFSPEHFRSLTVNPSDDRHLVVRDSDGSIVFSDSLNIQPGNLPSLESKRHSSTLYRDSRYLTATTEVKFGAGSFHITALSDISTNVLPLLDGMGDFPVKLITLTDSGEHTDSDLILLPAIPGAAIKTDYMGTRELDNVLEYQKTRMKMLMASSLIIVLILGIALAHELTKPLKLLVDATRKIKNGDYSISVPLMHRDEIGELAETIDSMRLHVGEREEEILKLAYADTLTNLPNRALFDDRLHNTVNIAERRKDSFAVAIMDMDRFKYINDVLGHESGDVVLKEVATRLKTTLRKSDTVARLGGDEFALLLQDVTEDDILTAVARIAAQFDTPVTLNNQPIDIGCSIGIATYPFHGEDASTLLRRADMAMYSAKRSDRVFAFYNPECDAHKEEHLSLLSEIKRAIEQDELQLFFQPKVAFGDSSVLSVETLLRWQHPSRGLIPPSEFIPFAEQTGAIRLITRWLISKAMVQARAWIDQGLTLKMSLNISARDLLDSDFPTYIKKRLDENNVDPHMICMEITESALMEDPTKARRTVKELHDLGLSISIDDYGTGYSSLAYVKNLPVNELKIDREFIKNMLDNKEDVAIVRSTIELGHNLGLKVVAEGIEREEEMEMLKDFGCDEAQGYLISKALSASDMENWIEVNRRNTHKIDQPPNLRSVG